MSPVTLRPRMYSDGQTFLEPELDYFGIVCRVQIHMGFHGTRHIHSGPERGGKLHFVPGNSIAGVANAVAAPQPYLT